MSFDTIIRLGALGLLVAVATPAAAQQGGQAQPSARDQVREAQAAIDEMSATRAYVEGLQTNAESEQDVTRRECVAKQLSSLNLLIEVSEQAVGTMQEAYAEGNDGRALAEGRKIKVAEGKAQEIRALADSCLGDDASADTTTVVDYEGGDEELEINPNNSGIGNDPPGASPFE